MARIAKSTSHLQQQLKALRITRDVSQEYVANHIGIEKKQIHQYETGKLLPSMRTLIKLCEFYQTTPNQLLGFKE
jgi:DNA-binding XRE family transcriptional regulator